MKIMMDALFNNTSRLYESAPNSSLYSLVVKQVNQYRRQIHIPKAAKKLSVSDCLAEVLEQTPLVFYCNAFNVYETGYDIVVQPIYLYSRGEANKLREDCACAISRVLKPIETGNAYTQALYIHDFLASKVKYGDTDSLESHNIVGPLLKSKGVCEGISKTYKALLDKLGIPCLLVQGECRTIGGFLEKHAWNLVYINGYWTHVDVTFDAGIKNNCAIRHDYFAIPSEQICTDHIFDAHKYPISMCHELSYYYVNHLIMDRKSSLKDYVRRCYFQGTDIFEFQIPLYVQRDGLEQKVQNLITEVLGSIGYLGEIKISYNSVCNVFQIEVIRDK